jgi:hypothetical protein
MRLSFIVLVAVFAFSGAAGAQNLRHVYRTAPSLVGLSSLAEDGRYQNAADVILEQAVRNLPLHPAASSAYTYRWDDEHGTLKRVDDAVAPWLLTERGQTLGKGLLNIGVTFGYYDVDSVDGHDLGHDPFPVSVCCGSKIRYQAPTDLLYTVGTFNFTYGLLDDLDLNIAIPIVTLDMGLDVTRQDTPSAPIRRATLDEHSANLSDMLVRANCSPSHAVHATLPARPAWQSDSWGQSMTTASFLIPQRLFSASVPAQRAQSAFGPPICPEAVGSGPRESQYPQYRPQEYVRSNPLS